MRNIRPVGVLLLALVLGLSAAAYAAIWLKQQGAAATMPVVVAKRDLPTGTRLQPDMLETVPWPKSATIKAPLIRLDEVVDRVILMPVLRGEPLLASKLAAPGEKGGLSSVLSDGQRAVTVKVNEIVGVAGFALPGNYVDVMVNTPDSQNLPVSKIVLERIQVLAVAQDVASNENKPRVVNAVTLQVSPQQAEQIDLARSVGTLSLVLRNQSDTTPVVTSGARKPDLLSANEPPAPARPMQRVKASAPTRAAPAAVQDTPAAPRLEVIRGVNVSQE